nr:phage Gp37/Gp68 family protein [Burkholderia glumae]
MSPGCANCYAERRNRRFGGGTATNWGPGVPRRRTAASTWAAPKRWNRGHAKFSRCTAAAGACSVRPCPTCSTTRCRPNGAVTSPI